MVGTNGNRPSEPQSPWAVFNQILYDVCATYPDHINEPEVAAKVVLIGRTYSVALERAKRPGESADDFYLKRVVPTIIESGIDEWISGLAKFEAPNRETMMPQILRVHRQVVDLIQGITDRQHRSFASKYLHFHRPEHFFIFDSRAEAKGRELAFNVPRRSDLSLFSEPTYHLFVERCLFLVEQQFEKTGVRPTPRELDTWLLE